MHSHSLAGTNGSVLDQGDDMVLFHAVTRNAWDFTRHREGRLTVPAGDFMLQRSGPPTFEAARQARATVLILPARGLGPLIGDRLVTGSSATAETRLLLGHVRLLSRSAGDLSPSGAQAAHLALIELVKGVLRQQPDATEPAHAPALAQAARVCPAPARMGGSSRGGRRRLIISVVTGVALSPAGRWARCPVRPCG
ncbi:hypothetical protein [Kitasatospora sp. NPDC094011]|uniref:hypothetical protein n=1 Tax=Kitasatospora sp. NPDC094011 TaxID=3364090 RepID=UPI0037F28F69